MSTQLSIQQKVEVLEKLECGVSVSNLAREYNVHPSTVRKIRKRGLPECQEIDMQKRKRIRKPLYDDLDTKLYLWFLEAKTLGVPITNLLLQEKALEISQSIGGSSTFKASRGWLWKFKNRHNICLLDSLDEKECIDKKIEEEDDEEDEEDEEKEEAEEDLYLYIEESNQIKEEVEEEEQQQTRDEEEEGKEKGEERAEEEEEKKYDAELEFAFEILNRRAETKPPYVRTFLLGLKEAFMSKDI